MYRYLLTIPGIDLNGDPILLCYSKHLGKFVDEASDDVTFFQQSQIKCLW